MCTIWRASDVACFKSHKFSTGRARHQSCLIVLSVMEWGFVEAKNEILWELANSRMRDQIETWLRAIISRNYAWMSVDKFCSWESTDTRRERRTTEQPGKRLFPARMWSAVGLPLTFLSFLLILMFLKNRCDLNNVIIHFLVVTGKISALRRFPISQTSPMHNWKESTVDWTCLHFNKIQRFRFINFILRVNKENASKMMECRNAQEPSSFYVWEN